MAIGLALAPMLFWLVGSATGNADDKGFVVREIAPDRTDPTIHRFNSVNVAMFKREAGAGADLFVFLPGTTRAHPVHNVFAFVATFLRSAADQGYRVIALQYDTYPAVIPSCAAQTDPACAEKVREKRVFGVDSSSLIDDRPQEAIVSRLSHLLRYLADAYPGEHWQDYLLTDGPRWERIAVAGHSQGAGMAAFIAKRQRVARVVLLSGPADASNPDSAPASWLSAPSATPAERWFAIFHAREARAAALQRAYRALAIPAEHVRELGLEPIFDPRFHGSDPNHVSIVSDPVTPRDPAGRPLYRDDWLFIIGQSPSVQR